MTDNKELIRRIYLTEFLSGIEDSIEYKELLSKLEQGEKAIELAEKLTEIFDNWPIHDLIKEPDDLLKEYNKEKI